MTAILCDPGIHTVQAAYPPALGRVSRVHHETGRTGLAFVLEY
ncbi:hypothetical protein [Sphaerisporangium album]|nr:hypothetical protein [Sphaerisporangium album]